MNGFLVLCCWFSISPDNIIKSLKKSMPTFLTKRLHSHGVEKPDGSEYGRNLLVTGI
jgi:hypothetical protein